MSPLRDLGNVYQGRRVLVTGGLGFIGSNLVHALVERGAQVTVADALIPQHGGDEYNIADVRSKIQLQIVDVSERDALKSLVEGQEFIFHLAGQMSHGDSMRNPELDLSVNCVATLRLVEACRQFNPSAVLLNTSTRQVYGKPQRLPVDEDHPTVPVDVNGINKLAAEYYHLLYHRVYDVRSVVLRLTNTYGPRQQISNDRQGMAGVFLYRALKGLPLRLFGGGDQLRDFNYVDDVVDALLLAAASPGCYGKVFNLGADRAYSLVQYSRILGELCGAETEIVPFPSDRKLIDIGDYYGTYQRFRYVTGWQPKYDLHEGLKKSVEFFARERDHYVK